MIDDSSHSTAFSVGCYNGNCAMEPYTWNPSEAEAIAAWNNRALPAVQPDARIKEYEEAYQYALHLAEALRENYPPNPDFRFLGDLVGLLTQIDNMVAGLSQPGKEVMPDGTRKVPNNDTAPAGLTAGGGAVPEPWNPATSPGMTDLMVDPDQMREDREERARLAREDDQ